MSNPTGFKRLPTCVKPVHYALHVYPDLEALTFTGHVTCNLDVTSECSAIVCNSADLEITSASFRCDGNKEWIPLEAKLSAERETLSCALPEPVMAGDRVQFRTVFSGVLTDKMCGLYRCKYTTPSGEVRYSAATQFEASDARRCFPCWDEPALKATFDISITARRDRVVLSNMPLLKEEAHASDSQLHVVTFTTSPIMSTYLVACVVGEFDHLQTTSADGVDIKVFTPLNKSEQGRFALECCAKILPYYKEYFGIAYPLPKLDLVAIPDFAQGAMENWGLVTFRETCVLVDPVNTSTVRRQWCAQIVGHELAHMWFGNLVTMEWWTDLWLNEGYAEFMMFLSTDFLFPHYNIWEQFISDCYVGALASDALRTSHPIEVTVNDPAEVEEIFDSISYNKGACVIRMLHDFLGAEDFKKGMRLYLRRHQFGNTQTKELWAALSVSSERPVGPVMSTWTRQMGYPVVEVQQRRDGTTLVLTLTQRRYLADGKSDEEAQRWMVPISFSCSAAPAKVLHKHLLDSEKAEVRLEHSADHHWVKLNPGSVGFYRVQYSSEMLDQFKSAIVDKTMPTLDRNSLLDDMFALVQAGSMTTAEFLRFAVSFSGETQFTVWSSLLGCLRRLRPLIQQTEMRASFWVYCRTLASQIFDKLGWTAQPNEDHMTTLLRPLVISHLVSFDHEPVLEEAVRMYHRHISGEQLIHPDFRSSVYRAALKRGGQSEYNTLLKLHKDSDLHEEKNRIANALGSVPNVELLAKVLEFALSDDVRAQESVFVIISVSSNRLGRDLTWDYYRKHCAVLLDRYKGRLLAILVKSITEDFCSESRALQVEEFFQKHPHPSSERSIRQAVEMIRLNSTWLQRDQKELQQYLTQFCQ